MSRYCLEINYIDCSNGTFEKSIMYILEFIASFNVEAKSCETLFGGWWSNFTIDVASSTNVINMFSTIAECTSVFFSYSTKRLIKKKRKKNARQQNAWIYDIVVHACIRITPRNTVELASCIMPHRRRFRNPRYKRVLSLSSPPRSWPRS